MQRFITQFRDESDLVMEIKDTSSAGAVSCALRGTPGTAGNTDIVVSSSAITTPRIITFTGNPADGETIRITDVEGRSATFEFDSNAGVAPGNDRVPIGATSAATLENLIAAVQGHQPGLAVAIDDVSGTGTVLCALLSTAGKGSPAVVVASSSITANDTDLFGGSDLRIDAKNVRVRLGEGHNLVFVGSLDGASQDTVSRVRETLTVTGGAGNDEIVVSQTFIHGSATVNLGNGTGDNVLVFAGRAGLAAISGNLTITGAAGKDLVAVDTGDVGGNVSARLGAGDNEFRADSCRIQGDFFYSAGSSASDTLRFESADIAGRFSATTGAGGDAVRLGGVTIVGPARLSLGTGHNQTLMHSVDILGSLAYSGGAGRDEVTVGQAGAQTVVFGGISINSGEGEDAVTILSASLRNTVTIRMASALAGSDAVTVHDTGIWGNTTITTGKGADIIDLLEVDFQASTTIDSGDGDDAIDIDGSRFAQRSGAVRLQTGGGDDSVRIATRTVADIKDGTAFLGPVSVNLGAGDDALLIGKSAQPGGTGNGFTHADFEGHASPASFNGGAGNNTIRYWQESGAPGLPILNAFALEPLALQFATRT